MVLRSDSTWWLTAFAPTNQPVHTINALQHCINGKNIIDGHHKKPLDSSCAGVCTVSGSWCCPCVVLRSDSTWWLTAFAPTNQPAHTINALQHCINGQGIIDGHHKKPIDASRTDVWTAWGSWHFPGAVMRSVSVRFLAYNSLLWRQGCVSLLRVIHVRRL